MKQFCLTTSMSKRLIGKALAAHPDIRAVLRQGTLAIIAGTTNGYVAEETLTALGQADGFTRAGFRRGFTAAPGAKAINAEFSGDVILVDGQWQRGKTVDQVADDLKMGDIILKGANAFDRHGQAAVQIGHPKGGTILAALPAVIGRRVRLIVPVGLEKRVPENIDTLVRLCNAPGGEGPRLMSLIGGEIFTEIDALRLLVGVDAHLFAAGGIYGAEGSSWLGVWGTTEQEKAAVALIKSIADEPPCSV
ncbi:MAG: hypothetical protein JW934_23215 [Anaerolineae bacterium]|nr:hypothetical protein [Anaerolineae bacterium]